MISSKLSTPQNENNFSDVNDLLETSFHTFRQQLMDRTARPRLYNNFIYIEFGKWVLSKPEIFWHLTGFSDKTTTKQPPCGRISLQGFCNNNCLNRTTRVILSDGPRDVCCFRALRISWITEIINLANASDTNIKSWIDGNQLHLRFQHDTVDYIALFIYNPGKPYYLISAFPLFYNYYKTKFDRSYASSTQFTAAAAAKNTP